MSRGTLTLRDTTDLLLLVNQWVYDHPDEMELNGGALPDDLAAVLAEVEASQTDRADAIAAKFDEFQSYIDRAKAARDRAARQQKVWSNAVAMLERYTMGELRRLGVDRLRRSDGGFIREQANGGLPAVDCSFENEALVDAATFDPDGFDDPTEKPGALALVPYMTVVQTVKLDKAAIARDYAAKRAELEENAAQLFRDEYDLEPAQMTLIEAFCLEHGDDQRAEAIAGACAISREHYVAEKLAELFPGVTVTRGTHLRID